jgi:hypothetical protein
MTRQRSSLLGLIVLAAFLGLPTLANAECAGVESQFSLLCRGPLSLVANWAHTCTSGDLKHCTKQFPAEVDLQVLFHKNPTESGFLGELLLPGHCAWVDRPLATHEPTRLRMRSSVGNSTVASIHGFETIQRSLIECAPNKSCVFEICSAAVGDPSVTGLLHMNPTFINTIYPVFAREDPLCTPESGGSSSAPADLARRLGTLSD